MDYAGRQCRILPPCGQERFSAQAVSIYFTTKAAKSMKNSSMWTPAVPTRILDALQAHILSPDATARQNPFFVSFVLFVVI